jgi:hypothetical protein
MAMHKKHPSLSQPIELTPSATADFDEVLCLIDAVPGRAITAFLAASGDYDLAASLALSQESA